MAGRQLPLPGTIVKKSNAIARARWQPESIWEPRIVALVASKVRESDEDFYTYRIPVTELTGISDENLSGYQYQEIAKSIERIGKVTISIQGKNPRNFVQYTIFAKCGYEDGFLIASFHPDLKSHFLNLKAQFTSYNLFEYLTLPSTYSQRIFEFLKSWENMPEVVVSVVELHDILNTPPSFRANFKEFRRRVLEKAHKDIHEHTKLQFEWEPIKVGRSVEKIRFTFGARRALAEKVKEDAKKKKRQRLADQRLLRAIDCAKKKNGDCRVEDNARIVCNLCKRFQMLREISSKNATPVANERTGDLPLAHSVPELLSVLGLSGPKE